MKLKSKKPIDIYPEYEGNGQFIEGADSIEEALSFLNKEMELEENELYTIEDGKLMNLHKCLDCEQEWGHCGDYCCGECGEYRLSKKYKEVYFFKRKYPPTPPEHDLSSNP